MPAKESEGRMTTQSNAAAPETGERNYDGLWGRQIKANLERREHMKTPTPRPWKWLPKEGQFIVDANRNIVAEIPCQSANPADGALIVTAVNERDALLAKNQELERERDALAAALRELMNWGVEFDDERLSYISVQVNREAIKDAQRALGETK